jgi:hypothetical protein
MKTACCSLLLAVWASAGCMTLPVLWTPPPKPEPAPVAPPPKPKVPVTAEQITDENAHQKAKALLEELNSDSTSEPPAPAAKPEPAKKP